MPLQKGVPLTAEEKAKRAEVAKKNLNKRVNDYQNLLTGEDLNKFLAISNDEKVKIVKTDSRVKNAAKKESKKAKIEIFPDTELYNTIMHFNKLVRKFIVKCGIDQVDGLKKSLDESKELIDSEFKEQKDKLAKLAKKELEDKIKATEAELEEMKNILAEVY